MTKGLDDFPILPMCDMPDCPARAYSGKYCHAHTLEVIALEQQKVAADAQALADVRTLDAYGHTECYGDKDGARVVLRHFDDAGAQDRYDAFTGPTPDAARHAAAEWVRKEQGK